MIDACARYMAARVVPDEEGNKLQNAVERSWIRFHGPMTKLRVDEATGWGSDQLATWAEHHDIELKISPGQVRARTIVWLKEDINFYDVQFKSTWMRAPKLERKV